VERPHVRYANTADGFSIAYTACGRGDAVVFLPFPCNHQQHAWNSLYRQTVLEPLAARFRLVHFDSRGQGMSTRGLPESHSIDGYLADLKAVIDRAAIRDVVLIASWVFWRTAVRYAALHPGQTGALVLFNPDPPLESVTSEPHPFEALASLDWENCLMMAIASYEPVREAADDMSVALMKEDITQSDYLRMLRAGMVDDTRRWLSEVRAPTLILSEYPSGASEHYRLTVASREIASAISGARLVAMEGMGSVLSPVGSELSPGLRLVFDFLARLPQARPQEDARPSANTVATA
jgi:pimeloyl-ACP methyl ester carboxylesterase